MYAKIEGYDDLLLVIKSPPPAYIVEDGKHLTHCGVTIPEGIAVYRQHPWGDGRTLAQAGIGVVDRRRNDGGYVISWKPRS